LEFEEVVRGRRSIRGYKPEPVRQKVIEEVIELATRAPSSMNTQPWHFYVVTGEPLDKIRKGNTELNIAGVKPSREFRSHGAYEGEHRRPVAEVASFVGFNE
jgi:nitroreductase